MAPFKKKKKKKEYVNIPWDCGPLVCDIVQSGRRIRRVESTNCLWRCRQSVRPKRRYVHTRLQNVMLQTNTICVFTSTDESNPLISQLREIFRHRTIDYPYTSRNSILLPVNPNLYSATPIRCSISSVSPANISYVFQRIRYSGSWLQVLW
jgi:hypothetical protein